MASKFWTNKCIVQTLLADKTESLLKFDMLETRMTNLKSKTGNSSASHGTSDVDAKIQVLEARFSAFNIKTDPNDKRNGCRISYGG